MYINSNISDARFLSKCNTGYIIIVFKLLNYDQKEMLESSWFEWSGAKQIYKYSPTSWNIKRITFHSLIKGSNELNNDFKKEFDFILINEFGNLMSPENIVPACNMVERLRLRYCGHVGIYKPHYSYSKPNTSQKSDLVDVNGSQDKFTDNNNYFNNPSSSNAEMELGLNENVTDLY